MTTFRRRYFDGQVTSPAIAGEAVTEEKIADNAVTSAKIKDETITGADIGAGQVQTDDIADGAVTLAKLGSNVSIVPLQDNAVTEPKIADSAVSSSKLRDGSVTPDKLDTHSVTSTKLNEGAVTASKIGTGEVTPTKLAAVDSPADGEVPTYNQAQSKLEWKPMASGVTRPLTPAIATDEIGDAQVTNPKIADRAVDWVKIALASINHELLYNVAPPTDGQILSFDAATGKFNWIAPPTGGAGGMQLTLLPSQPLVFSENSMADIDQLIDLSAWIPVTAQAVLVEIQLNAMSVPASSEQILTVLGRRAGADYGNSTIHFIWQNTAGFNNNAYKESVLGVDGVRQIKVFAMKNGVFTSTNIWVKGYIE
ncbi:MAG: hypothetical protein WC980_08885 [Candidatus Brocadiia bacterium]